MDVKVTAPLKLQKYLSGFHSKAAIQAKEMMYLGLCSIIST
jgi:hypothetical protein